MTDIPTVELIPRPVLFGNPVKTSPQISPDGKRMAYIAPVNNVLNVWVGAVGDDDATYGDAHALGIGSDGDGVVGTWEFHRFQPFLSVRCDSGTRCRSFVTSGCRI